MRIGAVVEGLGDRKAFPSLVAKVAQIFGSEAYVVHLIECGGWGALKRVGGLERYARLLLASAEVDRVIFAADLDDGCPAEEAISVEERRSLLSEQLNLPVSLLLIDREYETWFLQDLEGLRHKSDDVEWIEGYTVENPLMIRDAKGAFSRAMRLSYRPSVDQNRFTKRLDLAGLLPQSRSLRKLACALTDMSHEQLTMLI